MTDRTPKQRSELIQASAAFLLSLRNGSPLPPMPAEVAANMSLLADGFTYLAQGTATPLAAQCNMSLGEYLAQLPRHDKSGIPIGEVDWEAAIDLVIGIYEQDSAIHPIVADAARRLGTEAEAIHSTAALALAVFEELSKYSGQPVDSLLEMIVNG